MDIKDFILIGGGLLIAAVVAHGFWIAWRARQDPLRIELIRDHGASAGDVPDHYPAELPNGGARVIAEGSEPSQGKLGLGIAEQVTARQGAGRTGPEAPVPGRPGTGRAAPERVAAERPGAARAGTARPGTGRSDTERSGTERHATERQGTERQGTERQGTERATRAGSTGGRGKTEPKLGPSQGTAVDAGAGMGRPAPDRGAATPDPRSAEAGRARVAGVALPEASVMTTEPSAPSSHAAPNTSPVAARAPERGEARGTARSDPGATRSDSGATRSDPGATRSGAKPAPAAGRGTIGGHAGEAVEELIMINVLAPRGQPFTGPGLVEFLRARGLRYGDMNIFHRVDPVSRESLYSVANVVEPGTFDMADLDNYQSPGVCFFLQLPGTEHPMDTFEDMLKVSRDLALRLGGELKDERRSVMTGQTIEHCRQRISDFCRRRMSMRA